jgi:hypothetical protein
MRLDLLNIFIIDNQSSPWTISNISRYEKYFTNDPHTNSARPKVVVGNYDSKCYLNKNIDNWCYSLNISYSLGFEIIKTQAGENRIWYIEIPNKPMAMLFKLTWM